MSLKDFIDGMEIIKMYYDDLEGYHIGAEHDQIYLYETNRPITPEHREMLKELDWFQPELDEEDEYDPNVGWSSFV